MLKRMFLDHPRSVDETYLEHLRIAASFGFPMVAAGLACLIHALLPFLFTRTGSRCIAALYERNRQRQPGT